jgi:4-hydroxybenzoate polyprenyltransferase
MNRLRVYAQLVRLPNVFTAVADIAMAALVSGALAGGISASTGCAVVLVTLASVCLYCGGMVWNDYFDLDQDKRERPFRPIPSGRISPRRAAGLGALLLLGGLAVAGLATRLLAGGEAWAGGPLLLASLLVGAVLLYDRWLKRTWAGPVGMGTCRFLNVLLGVSPAPVPDWGRGVYLAFIVGVYIAGVTWFARTEARASRPTVLAGAAVIMLAGLALALPLPLILADSAWPHDTRFPFYPVLLFAFGFTVGLPVSRAIRAPSPPRVQAAVKTAVLGLIALDAILATAAVGWVGLVLLVLLAPSLYLGRRLYST